MSFSGPSALVVWAALAEDSDQREAALQEAESILDSGCVSHNHMWFAEGAIDLALKYDPTDGNVHIYRGRALQRTDSREAARTPPVDDDNDHQS